MPGRVFLLIGSLAATISVLAGAFGAHGLSDVLGSRAGVYETAARYHMYHALAIVLVGLLLNSDERASLRFAGWSFLAGILVFSGSLYGLAITGTTWLGAAAPVGGIAFAIGWILMGVGVWRRMATAEPPAR